MPDIVDARSCLINPDAQGKPALYAPDGVTLQDPEFVVIAGLPPAELSFAAQSPFRFVEPFITWRDPSRAFFIEQPPSIHHSLDASGTTLVITVTPAHPLPEELIYHFTMYLSAGNLELEPGASIEGWRVDPTIVEKPAEGPPVW